jgi:hypothetical protein
MTWPAWHDRRLFTGQEYPMQRFLFTRRQLTFGVVAVSLALQ